MSKRISHFRNAEGIRGLACLIVLATHSTVMFFPAVGAELDGVGKYGVWLFFVLSAFLLTNHLLIGRLTVQKLIDYGLGRVLRIIPLYLIAICVYWWLGTAGIGTGIDALHAATLTTGYAHLWTIPVETKFYVLLAALIPPVAWIHNRYGLLASLALVVAIGLLAAAIFPPAATPENSVELYWYIPCFLAGVGVALAYPWIPRVHPASMTVFNLALFIGLILITDYFRPLLGGAPLHGWLFNKFIPIGCAWAILVALNVDESGRWGTMWNLAPLRLIGRWSYPIYLFHWLIVSKAASVYPGNTLVLVLAWAVVLAMSAAVHECFERPLMALRPRFAHALARTPSKEHHGVHQCRRGNDKHVTKFHGLEREQ